MTSLENLTLSSNWNTLGEASLNKVVTYCSPEKKDLDLDDIVSLESCACVVQNNQESNAKPELKINFDKLITHIDIISEAQIIEVFGNSEEYLLTCSGEFIDDWIGMAVYHCKITLPNIPSCVLKLRRIKDPNRCWIYGIGIIYTETISVKPTRFNFENVNKLIETSGNQISEKAEKFKNFLQLYSNNSTNYMDPKNITVPPQMLLNILEEQYAPQIQDCKKNISQYFSNFCPDKFSSSQNGEFRRINKNRTDSQLDEPSNFDYLKNYIDGKMLEMKNDILMEIEVKLKEYRKEENEKLDRIIKLLEEKKQIND